ncbi:PREDICTED: granulins isoform X2 [Crocodylus porosus]|uniref:granulins isoform X2 n=1 Tax=Crocodylus porosus TaxID=8502 RepID=UPI00093C7941|nr:PREDICTED: granulins isoform X2 [Crocodylus porosus]
MPYPRMWTLVPLWLVLAGAVASLRCPDGRVCEGFSACCQEPGGDGYACCPLSLVFLKSLPMIQTGIVTEPSRTTCPDGTQCPAEYTCLRTSAGSFSCCPLSEAVSCADGHHCCPQGSHCSADSKSCFTLPDPRDLAAVQCPDGESQCPDDSTCCATVNGTWGCCPMPEASCCVDKVHCCPHATTCDLAHSRCLSADGDHPMRMKFPARKRMPGPGAVVLADKITCPDQKSMCPDGATCCQLPTNQYGCCPLQNAVCCSDHLHCCPQGTTCDLQRSKCTSALGQMQPLTRLPAVSSSAQNVKCDDFTSCPDGNSCCQLSTGAWGCCAYSEAVCCPDHVHCCPKGSMCDPGQGSCQKGGATISWLKKTPAQVRVTSTSQEVKCDDQTSCPDGNTCCRLLTGAWGCCPFTEAVCCSDHIHCCPEGFTCDPGQGICQDGGATISWLKKTPAQVRVTSTSQEVKCDDQMSCPDGNTCCRLLTGAWGCCPLPQATCCQDHVHCCPKGYKCSPEGGSCEQGGISIPWLEKTLALVRVTSASQNVKCDDEMSCPNENTCCRVVAGAWGCCPVPEATCCPDLIHCCPKGSKCDSTGSSCLQGSTSVPWLEKTPALLSVTSADQNVKCDNQHSCPDGDTCCRVPGPEGQWACCPLPQAVCCSDGLHCCSAGHICDLEHGKCLSKPLRMSAVRVHVTSAPQVQNVQCNATFSCEDGQTCCKKLSGAWACCQLPNAVCCKDEQHCCPAGYTCNLLAQTCEKQQAALPEGLGPSAVLLPASPKPSNDVACDSTHFCHDNQTCCRASTGAWACCPYKKGICCDDKRHCCPHGYHCTRKGLSCRWFGPHRWDGSIFSAGSPKKQKLL